MNKHNFFTFFLIAFTLTSYSPALAMQQNSGNPPSGYFWWITPQGWADKTKDLRVVQGDISENAKQTIESMNTTINRFLSEGPCFIKTSFINAIGLCLACTGIRLLYLEFKDGEPQKETGDETISETPPAQKTLSQKIWNRRSIIGTAALIAGIGLILKSDWMVR